jgi:hypothetical protein
LPEVFAAGIPNQRLSETSVLKQVGDGVSRLVEALAGDVDAGHLGFVLVLANFDIAVALVVGPLCMGDGGVAGGLQQAFLHLASL